LFRRFIILILYVAEKCGKLLSSDSGKKFIAKKRGEKSFIGKARRRKSNASIIS
jgi:hypothetical protein